MACMWHACRMQVASSLGVVAKQSKIMSTDILAAICNLLGGGAFRYEDLRPWCVQRLVDDADAFVSAFARFGPCNVAHGPWSYKGACTPPLKWAAKSTKRT